MTGDRNFDDIAHKFVKNIYGSGKGEIRQAVVWQDLVSILSRLGESSPLDILDAGGGLAQLSQQIAHRGHKVTLCDLSSQMLELAEKDIEEAGLLPQYRFVHAPAQEIAQHVDKPFDLMLFHAVMEWLADPREALDVVLSQVKPGGVASVMFYNQNGLLFKNLICGNLTHVEEGMPHRKRFKLQPQKGLQPEDVYTWIEEAGFNILGKSGVRTFHDYMKDTRTGEFTFEQVVAMEQKLCRQEPFISLGRYIHVYAQRPIES
ncbi:tRNA uridine 5-oxyacetic acid(34) methyltransferase CmoM [Grimontia marina]|uniref:tRNA 5-carboxymethoxyuridine methyltransferase n=1 Tax=Grimontia marina TaxID=646534 RepID=A0A128F6N6_9GAMM|nr:tRNA uridine 5-oxyacetic acid(34) methyltransferase CmoM [Grimontia marina]CZF82140.1 Ubiquinone biosynthesis O-methyltransferase [Grimontia marina]